MSVEELTVQHKAIAEALLDGKTQTEIAKTYGVSTKTVSRYREDATIQAYIATIQHRRMKEQGDWEGTAAELNDVFAGITAPGVIARIMQLAMLDPNETKGNIQGQIQALTFIWEKMGFQGPAPKKLGADGPEVYRATWMTETKQ